MIGKNGPGPAIDLKNKQTYRPKEGTARQMFLEAKKLVPTASVAVFLQP
jgi:hypothetical protein